MKKIIIAFAIAYAAASAGLPAFQSLDLGGAITNHHQAAQLGQADR